MRVTFVVVAISVTIVSCISFPSPKESSLIGSCFETVKPVLIWRSYNNIYVGESLFSTEQPRNLIDSLEPFGKLSVGTKVQLVEVLQAANGSYGRFLRARVKVMEGKHVGIVADVPACVPYHPTPRWVTNCTLDPDALIFNDGILKSCDS